MQEKMTSPYQDVPREVRGEPSNIVPQIVRLVPPLVTPGTILHKISCVRPMRDGRFNISFENISINKICKKVLHCYGHGGSGFTTLFGSVKNALHIFQQEVESKTKVPIRIIGSGCMGLTAAIELHRLGYTIAGITTQELYDIPSWRAAGYFAFVSVKTSAEEEHNLHQIGIETFKTYQTIDAGLHPYISSDSVRYMPIYGRKDMDLGLELLETHGLVPSREHVTLDFGTVQHQGYVKYMTYFMHTTQIMTQLTNEVHRLGIPIEIRKVETWDEVGEEIIVNCSGLGGRELNRDGHMIPVRGHLVLLNETSGTAHMDYIIYTSVEQDGRDENLYLFPKCLAVSSEKIEGVSCQGVIGGTFIPHADKLSEEELEQLDQVQFEKMLDRSRRFFMKLY